jgi:hypothetical protein
MPIVAHLSFGPSAEQVDVADQHRRVVEGFDGEAEIVLIVRAPLRDAFLRRRLGRRSHPTRQRRHSSGVHLPSRQRRQVILAQATQANPFADQDRIAIGECALHIVQFRHAVDPAASHPYDLTGARPAARPNLVPQRDRERAAARNGVRPNPPIIEAALQPARICRRQCDALGPWLLKSFTALRRATTQSQSAQGSRERLP